MRFLGLSLDNDVPDEKTIWLYREVLVRASMLDRLFKRFDEYNDERWENIIMATRIQESVS